MKPLEQMNIVDDFLAGSLIGHKEYGEAASRYILSCILNRKIGKLNVVTQKFLIGDNPESMVSGWMSTMIRLTRPISAQAVITMTFAM